MPPVRLWVRPPPSSIYPGLSLLQGYLFGNMYNKLCGQIIYETNVHQNGIYYEKMSLEEIFYG